MFRNLETVKQQIMDLDPNVERSMLVGRTQENGISCYRKVYEEKKKATSVQTTHSLTPWHYSPDGRKPPLIRFHSLIQCICGASG
jgi:hypothetical protein